MAAAISDYHNVITPLEEIVSNITNIHEHSAVSLDFKKQFHEYIKSLIKNPHTL